MEIKVTGLDDIMRNLATYESNLNIKLGQAIEGASQIIENKAKQLCPVDDGILRASITHKVINEPMLSMRHTFIKGLGFMQLKVMVVKTHGLIKLPMASGTQRSVRSHNPS